MVTAAVKRVHDFALAILPRASDVAMFLTLVAANLEPENGSRTMAVRRISALVEPLAALALLAALSTSRTVSMSASPVKAVSRTERPS